MAVFWKATLLLTVGSVWLVLSALANVPRVSFVNAPLFVPEQEIVTFYVRVPRHEDNRLLTVAAIAHDGIVSEMRRDLDGVRSQALWDVRWRLPAGELDLVATLFNAQQQVGRDVHRVTVYSQ